MGDGEVAPVGILLRLHCNSMLGVEIYGPFSLCCTCGVATHGWKTAQHLARVFGGNSHGKCQDFSRGRCFSVGHGCVIHRACSEFGLIRCGFWAVDFPFSLII